MLNLKTKYLDFNLTFLDLKVKGLVLTDCLDYLKYLNLKVKYLDFKLSNGYGILKNSTLKQDLLPELNAKLENSD